MSIQKPKRLAYFLYTDLDDLKAIAADVGRFYHQRKIPKKSKNPDGSLKYRVLTVPRGKLEQIQEIIDRVILKPLDATLPSCVMAYVTGSDKGSIQNAKAHQGKKYRFVTDIKDFYPSISNTRVNRMFRSEGISRDVAHLLTNLVTHDHELPQGTHTSPRVSNLCFKPIDFELMELCESHVITYKRYADDLSFSSQVDFQHLVPEIIQIIAKGGFKLNRGKTGYTTVPVEITGAIVKQNELSATKKQMERFSATTTPQLSREGLGVYIKKLQDS